MPEKADQTRLVIAALTACLVRTLNDETPNFLGVFLANLEKTYVNVRESGIAEADALGTLGWTRELIKKMK